MDQCTCKVRCLRFTDPSGNEREEMPVGVPGWKMETYYQPGPWTHSHNDDCPVTQNPPIKVEIPTYKRKTSHIGNGAPSGPFAFTLTKSPKDPQSVGDMLTAVRKIMAQKSNPVKSYAWYYEDKGRDENGDAIHPHIHGMYETESGGRIESKHFKRAWPLWDPTKRMGSGFKGGYHDVVKSEEKYDDYIKKDGGMGESNGLK